MVIDNSRRYGPYDYKRLLPKRFGAHLRQAREGRRLKSPHFWMSVLMRYLLRPNLLTVHKIIRPALESVFPPPEGVPRGLASVFIRWGDKGGEMELLPILRYVGAVEKIAAVHGLLGANVHVFVMTEDHAALREFRTQAKPRGWRVYAYEKAIVQTSRRASSNSNLTNVANKLNASAEERRAFYNALIARRAASRIAPPPVKHAAGGMGMHSLIALILAMEAEHYVLTISSSWSKLVNALRLALFPKHKRGDADLLFSREFGHWKTIDPLYALGYIDAGNTVSADSFNAIEYMADYSSVPR